MKIQIFLSHDNIYVNWHIIKRSFSSPIFFNACLQSLKIAVKPLYKSIGALEEKYINPPLSI